MNNNMFDIACTNYKLSDRKEQSVHSYNTQIMIENKSSTFYMK